MLRLETIALRSASRGGSAESAVAHWNVGVSIAIRRPPCLGTVVRVANTRLPYSPRLSPVRQMRNPVGGSWFGAVFGPPQIYIGWS